jgi:hypothetical protein
MQSQDQTIATGSSSDYLNYESVEERVVDNYRRDASWVRTSFIAPYSKNADTGTPNMDPVDVVNMTFSTANFKFWNTSLGGHPAINPLPQLTRYADIKVKSLMADAADITPVQQTSQSLGLGRYYSEAFDDHFQIIHFRFGVASYNSLIQFFTGFYNSSAGSLARTGRVDKSFLDHFLNFGANLIAVAIFPLAFIPIIFIFAGQAVRYLLKIPASKFYYLKPTMPAYWTAVQTMFNQLCVNRGLVTYTNGKQFESFIGEQLKFSNLDSAVFNQLYPEFSTDGVLDVKAVATRHKRLELRHRKMLLEQLSKPGPDGWFGKVQTVYQENLGVQQVNAEESLTMRMVGMWNKFLEPALYSKTGADSKEDGLVEKDLRRGPDVSGMDVATAMQTLKGKWEGKADDSVWKYFLASADDGHQWASFRVKYTGPVSESFTNSYAPSAMAQKLNAGSASKRDLSIDLAGGNIDPWGIAQTILNGVGTVLATTADILHVSGLAAFAGNAFVDIPDHWDNSSSQLASTSYTIELRTPYNNLIGQMLHIYMPLCMLLCGALPLMTGKQSHTSPFLCELYDRGRSITRLGQIQRISISRGTGNVGWNKDAICQGIDVTFEVKDLSTVMAIPIQQGASMFPLDGIFDEQNTYTDVLMAWSGLSLRDVNDRMPILKRQIDTKIANIKSTFTMSRLMMDLGDSSIGALASMFMSGTPKK